MESNPVFRTIAAAIGVLFLAALAGRDRIHGQTVTPVAKASFNRDVRPILTTCFRCHGPDAGSRQAGLRLDLRDEAIKPRRNGTPIAPGNATDSLIVKRIFETDARRIMPPAGGNACARARGRRSQPRGSRR